MSPGALPFEYERLREAKHWTPGGEGITGSEGNEQITATYHEIDDDFSVHYLGPANATVPSWLTFAKAGSGSAGVQIGNIESALDAVKQLTDGVVTIADKAALETLAELVAKGGMPEQVLRFCEHIVNQAIEDIDPDVIRRGIADAQRLRNALVEGNTEIYNNAVPLFRAFIAAEIADSSGPAAIRAMVEDPSGLWSDESVAAQWAGHLGRPLIPAEAELVRELAKTNRELVIRAFDGYKAAHLLSRSGDPQPALREALIRQANMDFVTFEQLFAQPIYNKIHDLTGATAGTARLYDAAHRERDGGMTLTPNLGADRGYPRTLEISRPKEHQGNWGDFMTRMGFVEVVVAPGDERRAEAMGARRLTIPVVARDAEGRVVEPMRMEAKRAWVMPDPSLTSTTDPGLSTRGTISDYFLGTPSGGTADELIHCPPEHAKKSFTYVPASRAARVANRVFEALVPAARVLEPATGGVRRELERLEEDAARESAKGLEAQR